VCPARWEAVAPTAGLPVVTPVEITLAEPAAAQALQASLAAAGIPATLVQAPGGNAQTVLFTEGLAPTPMTARHWAALAASRHARQPGGVFRQPGDRPGQRLGRRRRLGHGNRGTGIDQGAGIGGLMVVDRPRQRHQ